MFSSELLKELNSTKVYIKDKENVNKIIQNIISDGKDKLQVISDFDRTLTKQHENGKPHISSFGLFKKCPSISPRYVEQGQNLMKKYYPIEIDTSRSDEEKKVVMEEWWSKINEAIKSVKCVLQIDDLKVYCRGETVSIEDIALTTITEGPSLRDGTKQLFDDLYKANIPVLVFSAGLGDSVLEILKHSKVYLPNVRVISNFLLYDEKGVIQGFKNYPLIHVFNKNEYAVNDSDYVNKIKDRKNVFLMGDSLGDRNMAEGVQNAKNILKIGFLYDLTNKCLPSFMDAFDIVLEDDQTMDVPRAILNHIF
ncbi:hypothetical protein FQR65_LT06258 [Abscondita terminalis]|nr:hypothetical protein FQR65_LT06258 [Abscondita terminalis]